MCKSLGSFALLATPTLVVCICLPAFCWEDGLLHKRLPSVFPVNFGEEFLMQSNVEYIHQTKKHLLHIVKKEDPCLVEIYLFVLFFIGRFMLSQISG